MNNPYRLCGALVLFCLPALGGSPETSTQLTPSEQEEIDRRLERFSAWPPAPDVMSEKAPKVAADDGTPVTPNAKLKLSGPPPVNPLLRSAQAKATPVYQEDRCRSFLRKHFPELKCDSGGPDATIEANDRPEALLRSWLKPNRFIYSLDALPTSAEVKGTYWSGDYWRTFRGLTSYRYSTGATFKEYRESVKIYTQPTEWLALSTRLEAAAKEVVGWSPAEKYDLTVGDEAFTLTEQQKHEGEKYLATEKKVPSWFGLCHGWAAAAIFVPPAVKAFTVRAARDISLTWYPSDVHAMASLAWSNGNYPANLIGGRCNESKPATYPNGRLKQQECFDTNPASLHYALGNMLGVAHVPFIMDSAFDAEVWNQPILSYDSTYFNPLEPTKKSRHWEEVAVPYDDSFKAKDRFQKPLTRGKRLTNDRGYDDSGIVKVVGVTMTLVYLGEVNAVHKPVPAENTTVRVTYTYDLEMHDVGGSLRALGGEWHENAHPDFLWVPQKGAVAYSGYDRYPVDVRFDQAPTAWLSRVASATSRTAYPLCQVLKKLVDESSGDTRYQCAFGR